MNMSSWSVHMENKVDLSFVMSQPGGLSCKDVLLKLHTDPRDRNSNAAKAEFYQIKSRSRLTELLGNSWWHIIKKTSHRRRAMLAIGITGIIQCSGVLGTHSALHLKRIRVLYLPFYTSHQQLWTSSLQVPQLLAGEAVAIPGCLADICSGAECHGNAVCWPLPPQ